YLIRFKRLQGSNHSLALGSAIGAAVGATPTLPLHNVLILSLTLPLRANPIAGILAANVVSNPLTFGPQYYLAWKIGDWLLPGRLSWEKISATLTLIKTQGIMDSLGILRTLGWDAIVVMLSGGLVLALPCGLATYVLVFRFFTRMRAKRREKHLLSNTPRHPIPRADA
ncbi:MAG TPA: DUF2062 domain-containing protein, partial [Myxococcota bacterium]|nr:DUF2062 domain-containing protein [Myxococcota bacterium]